MLCGSICVSSYLSIAVLLLLLLPVTSVRRARRSPHHHREDVADVVVWQRLRLVLSFQPSSSSSIRPGITLCGCQDINNQLLANTLPLHHHHDTVGVAVWRSPEKTPYHNNSVVMVMAVQGSI